MDVKGCRGQPQHGRIPPASPLAEELEAKKKTLVAATAVPLPARSRWHSRGCEPGVVKQTANTALQQASQAAGSGRLDGADLHLRLHRVARRGPGGGHLGVHLRDLPEPPSRGGQALGSATHWVFAALLTTFFPHDDGGAFAPGYVFLFFCGMMVLQLVWVKTMVPETKGVPLEQMQKRLGIAEEPA